MTVRNAFTVVFHANLIPFPFNVVETTHNMYIFSINRILTTANQEIRHSSQDHTKENSTKLVVNCRCRRPLGFWKDTNTLNLPQWCWHRDLNRRPSSWEFTVLAPRPSWLLIVGLLYLPLLHQLLQSRSLRLTCLWWNWQQPYLEQLLELRYHELYMP